MSLQRKKKPVEFHFVDMNDPDRYKKLKVARACDFCRRRKSKCDIGIPGSGTCSNCQKHQTVCIFSPVVTNPVTPTQVTTPITTRPEDTLMTPQQFNTFEQFLFRFPLLQIKNGQVGYEMNPLVSKHDTHPYTLTTINISSIEETKLFHYYFNHIHLAYPLLLKQSITNIHNQDRLLLSKPLRFAIMALAADNEDYYHVSKQALDKHLIRLDTVQTFLLLYKYDEIHFKSGCHDYLSKAKHIIGQLNSVIPQQQEMINRAKWILFSNIALSNLSDKDYFEFYKAINIPEELPQALKEEIEENYDSIHEMNRFSQIVNLSVLYSHTASNLILDSTNQLICLKQFKEIRRHWYESLHPIIQNKLMLFDQDINIMILYNAILYDILYLLLLSYYHSDEWDGIETAYQLLRMISTFINNTSYQFTLQSKRMTTFGLMLCLQVHISRQDEKIDYEYINQIHLLSNFINLDNSDQRLDIELSDLCALVVKTPLYTSNQPVDYFSMIPNNNAHHDSNITPGVWSTTNGLNTPIHDNQDFFNNTSEWILEQQRQQHDQFQLYQLQLPHQLNYQQDDDYLFINQLKLSPS